MHRRQLRSVCADRILRKGKAYRRGPNRRSGTGKSEEEIRQPFGFHTRRVERGLRPVTRRAAGCAQQEGCTARDGMFRVRAWHEGERSARFVPHSNRLLRFLHTWRTGGSDRSHPCTPAVGHGAWFYSPSRRSYMERAMNKKHGSYGRFVAMIATSTAVMFGLTYSNVYGVDHIFWSETRAFMALIMGSAMAVVMLAYMLGMYRNKKANVTVLATAVIVFAVSLYLVRSQRTVQDVAYMKAMIPHHSIAILTSERAEISDPRVRQLADEIIQSQRREIEEMTRLVANSEAR